MITAAQHAEIRRLFFAEHWKLGTIVTQLGLHLDTVRAAVGNPTFRNDTAQIRPSGLDPYKAFIAETLERYPRLRATRVFEMVRARGYPGSVKAVRRYVQAVRPRGRRESLDAARRAGPGRLGQLRHDHPRGSTASAVVLRDGAVRLGSTRSSATRAATNPTRALDGSARARPAGRAARARGIRCAGQRRRLA